MILLRHANGYVTAYAHNAQNLVERGERIKKGQVIARVGPVVMNRHNCIFKFVKAKA